MVEFAPVLGAALMSGFIPERGVAFRRRAAEPFLEQAMSAPGKRRLIQRIMGIVPGYKGYLNRDAIRETDAVLRRSVAGKLDSAKLRLNEVVDDLTRAGRLDVLDPLGALQQRLGRVADTIRLAPQGASGRYDNAQINEETLEAIHQADLKSAELAGAVAALANKIRTDDALNDMIKDTQSKLRELEDAFEQRARALESAAGADAQNQT